ncbi:MAG: hypothetical protein E7403_06140 [Ruminococcaceae bacterium]|nr:hypothetical protein [Oscillospiraceae bacterium]
MKRKINILIPIFALLVLIYVIRSMMGPQIRVETLREGSLEDLVSTKGLLIKNETVLRQEAAGNYESSVQEGTRISAGQEIAAVYSGTVSPELRTRLEQINSKIEQIEKNQADLINFSDDISRLEQKISDQTSLLVEKSILNDLSAVGDIQLVLASLCEKKAQISGVDNGNSILNQLQQQKSEIEAQIGTAQHRITAPVPGLFSASVDGLEQIITPNNMTQLTPSQVDSLFEQAEPKNEEAAGTSYKIINNFLYYVAVNIPTDKLSTLRPGQTVNLRFYDLSGDLVKADIKYISPEENGFKTVLLEVNQHLESLLKRRVVNVEFIKSRYNGYRISIKCLREKDGEKGVYVRRDDMLKFIPVDILYSSQDIAIVDSASKETPLRLYDEVVVRANSYEEGKLLS